MTERILNGTLLYQPRSIELTQRLACPICCRGGRDRDMLLCVIIKGIRVWGCESTVGQFDLYDCGFICRSDLSQKARDAQAEERIAYLTGPLGRNQL